MIKLTEVRDLLLAEPLGANPHAHLSAASGLVKIGKWLFIVADDEKHMVLVDSEEACAPISYPIMEGELPLDSEARKKIKHDFEAIVHVPSNQEFPFGGLLILGSGSKKQREQGVIIPFLAPPTDMQVPTLGAVCLIDLDPIYDALKDEPGKTNIEGAVILGNEILLFQRGNKNNRNAIIRFKWKEFFAAATGAENKTPKYSIQHYELGEIATVPLCFTDATALADGRLIFSAAAESTSDAYTDGACMGSAIGIIGARGELIRITQVNKKVKLEGVEVQEGPTALRLWLVSDPDDALKPGQLFTAQIDRY